MLIVIGCPFVLCNNSTVAYPEVITATDQKNPSYVIRSRYTSRWCWREDMPLERWFWSTSQSCSCCSLWIWCFCPLNVSSKVSCLRWAAAQWRRLWAGWSVWCWVWWGARGKAIHLCHRESSHRRPLPGLRCRKLEALIGSKRKKCKKVNIYYGVQNNIDKKTLIYHF